MMIKVINCCILLVLLSSCSIFKKKSTLKQEYELERVEEIHTKEREAGRTDAVTVTNEETGTVTEVEADELTISPTGEISAKNAKAKQTQSKKVKSEIQEVTQTTVTRDADRSIKETADVKIRETESKPDTAVTGQLFKWVIVVVVALAAAGWFYKRLF